MGYYVEYDRSTSNGWKFGNAGAPPLGMGRDWLHKTSPHCVSRPSLIAVGQTVRASAGKLDNESLSTGRPAFLGQSKSSKVTALPGTCDFLLLIHTCSDYNLSRTMMMMMMVMIYESVLLHYGIRLWCSVKCVQASAIEWAFTCRNNGVLFVSEWIRNAWEYRCDLVNCPALIWILLVYYIYTEVGAFLVNIVTHDGMSRLFD